MNSLQGLWISNFINFSVDHGKENQYKYRRQDSRKRKSKPGGSRRNVKRRRKTRHHLSFQDYKKATSPLREDSDEPESSDEEELLKLRLHALKSTLEMDKEMDELKSKGTNFLPDEDKAISNDHTEGICEEDSLRIQVKTKFQSKLIGN